MAPPRSRRRPPVKGVQPTPDGLARISSKRDVSPWNTRRCVCGEAFDDHVHAGQGKFPCARPRCGCRDFEEAS